MNYYVQYSVLRREQQGGGHFRSCLIPHPSLSSSLPAFPSINTNSASLPFRASFPVPLLSSHLSPFHLLLLLLFLLHFLLLSTTHSPNLQIYKSHRSYTPNYFNRLNCLLFITAHHVVRGAHPSFPLPHNVKIESCSHSISLSVESLATSTTWLSGIASSSLTLCSMVCPNNLFRSPRVGNRC